LHQRLPGNKCALQPPSANCQLLICSLLLPCIQIHRVSNTSIGSRAFPVPAALLAHVLSYVPLSQRLGRAALVCRAWHAAADAASTSITHSFKWYDPDAGAAEATSIEAWLRRGAAQHITALALDGIQDLVEEEDDKIF
jgi:hypothetical protein